MNKEAPATASENGEGKNWFSEEADAVLDAFDSDSEKGLSEEIVKKKQEKYGENRLPSPSRRSPLKRFVSQFNNLFIYLLLVAGVATALLQEWLDSGVIFGVVVIIAVIGFIQEGKAERALESVRGMLSRKAVVRRAGQRREISAEKLVPGDIVLLNAGDRVPADLRLLKSKSLEIQEAALTGESAAVEKHSEPVEADAELGDRASMAYSGTVVTSGQGTGVVVAIGEATEIGRISGMLSEVEKLKTPLTKRLDHFAKQLSVVIVVIALITFGVGTMVWGREWSNMFFAAVSIAVAAIPSGLPAVMTVTLAIGVERMARCNAIIRRLPAVETLGAVTTICADKTGTLTRNEMTAKTVRTADEDIEVEGVGYEPEGQFLIDEDSIDIEKHDVAFEMLRAGLLCNDSEVRHEDEEWKPEGDPTEVALIVLARKAGFDSENRDNDWPRIDAIPFSSERRYMATLNRDSEGQHYVYVKGAPERVLEMCTGELREGDIADLDAGAWEQRAEDIASRGQRLLAIARKETSEKSELNENDVEQDLVMLGLFGMVDPPREEAIRSVEICHGAGIGVKMITGDHVTTAVAVARELGLKNLEDALRGRDIEELSDEELEEKVMAADVFARASPEHKLRLVKALQKHHEVIAMTGDGVNDAPALKRADVGIAMGQKGTEAAREASDMVLADDNFASIELAVEEGRKVYDNLRKAILFLLPTNAGEALIIMTAIMLGRLTPISPVQILWINMVTAVSLGIAFAWEKAEGSLMQRPPRDTEEPLLTGFTIWRIGFVGSLLLLGAGGLFLLEQAREATTVDFARTLAVNALVMGEIFYLLNTRFFSRSSISWQGLVGNRAVVIAIVACIGLQVIFTYAPFMNLLFASAPLDAAGWAKCVAVGLIIFLLVETEKFVLRRRSSSGSGNSNQMQEDNGK